MLCFIVAQVMSFRRFDIGHLCGLAIFCDFVTYLNFTLFSGLGPRLQRQKCQVRAAMS